MVGYRGRTKLDTLSVENQPEVSKVLLLLLLFFLFLFFFHSNPGLGQGTCMHLHASPNARNYA